MSALPDPSAPHFPVMLAEVVEALNVRPGSVIVDGTFGAGGYSRALLEAGAVVHGFDRDPDAIAAGQKMVTEFGGRLILHSHAFSQMRAVLADHGVTRVDGVVLDIGVSSMQLDQAARGFSFQADGPLDMRMAQSGMSAADFLNDADEGDIADIIYRYGEERQSRRIARFIVGARPLSRTGELAAIVRRALGHRDGAPKDPATRTFQALRIHVNGELDELEAALAAAEHLLHPGGRLVVVSFHSLEDRIVKQFLRDAGGKAAARSRHLPVADNDQAAPVRFARVSKAIRASDAELAINPRSRSATLRWAERTDASAWADQGGRA